MPNNPKRKISAFTFVELVVALAVGACVVTVATLAYGTIFHNGLPSIQDQDVRIPMGTMESFYEVQTNAVSVSRAPNFTAAASAESMRSLLQDDIANASAVFCLGRSGLNTVHTNSLTISETNDVRAWTGAANFRALLPNGGDFTTNTSNAIRGGNLSIYVLSRMTNSSTTLIVRAIYDADMVSVTNTGNGPAGVYASVRRYEGTTRTAFYHVFYTSDDYTVTNTFWPMAYYYPRGVVNGVTNSRPFYLVWLPDPAVTMSLYGANTNSDACAAYTNMAGQSSFSFVVPAFPGL